TGTRVGEQYGLIALGLFKDWDEINDPNTPVQSFGAVQPGDIKYKDMNGDNKIDSRDETFLDRVYRPECMYGFSVGYTYKNFDISALFQGAIGGNTWFTGKTVFPFQSKAASVLADAKDNHFNEESNPDPHAKWPRLSATDNSNNYRNSTFWLKKKDYLRLKNVEIGYNMPKSFLSTLHINSMRVYLTALNLLTWDNLKIADPESTEGTGYYPQQSVYNIGVNITF
ncbi:MAG: SusC/RagA family protein, partial [Bacteroides sp.]